MASGTRSHSHSHRHPHPHPHPSSPHSSFGIKRRRLRHIIYEDDLDMKTNQTPSSLRIRIVKTSNGYQQQQPEPEQQPNTNINTNGMNQIIQPQIRITRATNRRLLNWNEGDNEDERTKTPTISVQTVQKMHDQHKMHLENTQKARKERAQKRQALKMKCNWDNATTTTTEKTTHKRDDATAASKGDVDQDHNHNNDHDDNNDNNNNDNDDDDDNDNDNNDDDDIDETKNHRMTLRSSSRRSNNREHGSDESDSTGQNQQHHSESRTSIRSAVSMHAAFGTRRPRILSSSSRSRQGRRAHQAYRSGDDSDSMNSDSSDDLGALEVSGFARRHEAHLRRIGSLADTDTVHIDKSVSWESIGGLDAHIQALKEMVVLPLLYPELFSKYHVAAPGGVLFFGPPGTGKTLVARALANSVTTSGTRVSFFMRKGADCLSKWVGESERQLRLLFEEATKQAPSIIFFDEIDALAPVRSSRQDQIHASIVSTLLALMDGFENRGQVVVIGATNRIDAIDPALRRPGRFDRELAFQLPNQAARKRILEIHTRSWSPPLHESVLSKLAAETVGYCGADLQALCTETCLRAVRRTWPQIYHSTEKLQIDPQNIRLLYSDFVEAMHSIVPASQRSSILAPRALPFHLIPLLQHSTDAASSQLKRLFPLGAISKSQLANLDSTFSDTAKSSVTSPLQSESALNDIACDRVLQTLNLPMGLNGPMPLRPRFLIHGPPNCGQNIIALALLHMLEDFTVSNLDLPTLYVDSNSKSVEESLVRTVTEACMHAPSILFWPHANIWWNTSDAGLRSVFLSVIRSIPPSTPVLLLATSDVSYDELTEDPELHELFMGADSSFEVTIPDEKSRQAFFSRLKVDIMRQSIPHLTQNSDGKTSKPLQPLPKASVSSELVDEESKLTAEQLQFRIQKEDQVLLELRVKLRAIITRLMRTFKDFVYIDWSSFYKGTLWIVAPISLDDIQLKNNERKYTTVSQFLTDIDQLVVQFKEYYHNLSEEENSLGDIHADNFRRGRHVINQACQLQDIALAMATTIHVDLVDTCNQIRERRLKREAKSKILDSNVSHAVYHSVEGCSDTQVSQNCAVDQQDDGEAQKLFEMSDNVENHIIPDACLKSINTVPLIDNGSDSSNDSDTSLILSSVESTFAVDESVVSKSCSPKSFLPLELWDKLMSALLEKTVDSNIQELEEINFRLFQVLYKDQGENDKTKTLQAMLDIVHKL